jgi:hypothetical protein
MAFGTAIGAGTGLLLDPHGNSDGDVPNGLAIVGTTVGLAGGGLTAWGNQNPVEVSDSVVTGLTTGWVTWQAVGWASVTGPDSRYYGLVLVIPAAAGAGAALAAPVIDIPVQLSVAGTSLGLWGAYLGGVTAEVRHRDVLTYALVGSDLGLVAGVVAMSPAFDTPPFVIGLADAGGVVGGSLFALGASFATAEREVVLGASLAGAGVGFVSGAVVAGALRGTTRDLAFRLPHPDLPGTWSVTPAGFRDGDALRYGAKLEVRGW